MKSEMQTVISRITFLTLLLHKFNFKNFTFNNIDNNFQKNKNLKNLKCNFRILFCILKNETYSFLMIIPVYCNGIWLAQSEKVQEKVHVVLA